MDSKRIQTVSSVLCLSPSFVKNFGPFATSI